MSVSIVHAQVAIVARGRMRNHSLIGLVSRLLAQPLLYDKKFNMPSVSTERLC